MIVKNVKGENIMKKIARLFFLTVIISLAACSNETETIEQEDQNVTAQESSDEQIDIEEQEVDNLDNVIEEDLDTNPAEILNNNVRALNLFLENDIVPEMEGANYVDLHSFIYEPKVEGEDKYFIDVGFIEMSDYYNYEFRELRDYYQAFELEDYEGNRVFLYGLRDEESTQRLVEDIRKGIAVGYFILADLYDFDTGGQNMAVIHTYLDFEDVDAITEYYN